MIELGHIATSALLTRSMDGSASALVAGMAMHALMDVAPHGEINDRSWEIWSSAAGILTLAARYGWKSPVTWGAIGGVLPDVEHVLPRAIRPTTALFPSHRFRMLHSENPDMAIPAWLQVVAGGAVIGALVATRSPRRRR